MRIDEWRKSDLRAAITEVVSLKILIPKETAGFVIGTQGLQVLEISNLAKAEVKVVKEAKAADKNQKRLKRER